MTIEIRELVIRAVAGPVHTEPQGAETDEALSTARADQGFPARPGTPALDQDAIVQACVQQVMRILRKMKER